MVKKNELKNKKGTVETPVRPALKWYPQPSASKHPLEEFALAGHLERDAPAVVEYERGRGYPWPPFASHAEDYFSGASSIGGWQDSWSWYDEIRHADIATQYRHKTADFSRDEDAKQFILGRFKEQSREAMKAGSLFHEWSALFDAARDPGEFPSRCDERWRDAWASFVDEYQVEWLGVERSAYNPSMKLAGTIDRIARLWNPPKLPGYYPGCVVVVDLKTTSKPSRDVYPSRSYVWQVCALAHCTHVVIEEERTVVPIPRFDGGVVVSVCTDGRPHVRFLEPFDPVLSSAVQAHAYAKWVSSRMGTSNFGYCEVPQGIGAKNAAKGILPGQEQLPVDVDDSRPDEVVADAEDSQPDHTVSEES